MDLGVYRIIEKKSRGEELTYEEIKFFIKGVCNESIPDYQISALLMAIFIRGMNTRETADLTKAMADSGEKMDLSSIRGIKVDKHSTGGVGDKTTLIIGPIAAACGVPIIKMSGAGLGYTGGTADKLLSIPGYRINLPKDEIIRNVRKIHISLTGHTGGMVPADKKLYAIRDVTATVDSIPLIASSIMSKKIASGADKILIDVKCGSGAFMKNLDQALELASLLVGIGSEIRKKTVVLVTNMDVPLGRAVGNSLEVIEAIEVLKGKGPKDLKAICLELAAHIVYFADLGNGDMEVCRDKAKDAINTGKALNKLKELIRTQGGDDEVVDNYELFKQPLIRGELKAECEGFIESMDASIIGHVSTLLGAGRITKESKIDFSAGVYLYKKTGAGVKEGDVLAEIYTDKEDKVEEALEMLKQGFKFSRTMPQARPLILAYMDDTNTFKYVDQ